MHTAKEITINVPEIEPRLKHETIFNTFDKLRQGESFIIHNDHDPVPLYYQLQNIHGSIFSWEYLQDGPEWWDIRVTKIPQESNEPENEFPQNAVYKNTMNEYVVIVPNLEPRLKHPTIFKVFNNLKEGESMIIHNNHDPKPLYYQLLAEHGEIFTWDYLEEGPQWWDIRIRITGFNDKETIGEIAANSFKNVEIFDKYGIDYCCDSKKTVFEICKELNVNARQVEQELLKVSDEKTPGYTNFNEWDLGFLADYIVQTHHNFTRNNLNELSGYAEKVFKAHGSKHPELEEIRDIVQKVNSGFISHLEEEEKILFPLIKKIILAKANNTAGSMDESLENLITKNENQHISVLNSMKKVRSLSKDYALPDDACASYTLLFKMLQNLEKDMKIHIHLENNILFPKAIQTERELKNN
ncbi:MAG: DUF542 domain-containing protein [Weeksellaceae bacterium]